MSYYLKTKKPTPQKKTTKKTKPKNNKPKKIYLFYFKAINSAKILLAQDKITFLVTQSMNSQLLQVSHFHCPILIYFFSTLIFDPSVKFCLKTILLPDL